MTDLSGPAPADPVAGEPGVFDYIDWLKTSILELDAAKARALDVLAKAGGTMTGPLLLDNVPGGPFLRMIDSGGREVMARPSGNEGAFAVFDGDWVTLKNIRCADPTADVHAATKGYVDQKVVGASKNVSFSAGSFTFNPGLAAAPTAFVITQIVATGGGANATANFAIAPGVTATSATIYCNVGGSAYTGPAEFTWLAVLP